MSHSLELEDFVFAGLTGFVVALDRRSGEEIWRHSLEGSGYGLVSLLLDGDLLLVGAGGRTYALDPFTGDVAWMNRLPGLGFSTVSLATVRGTTDTAGHPRAGAQQQYDGA